MIRVKLSGVFSLLVLFFTTCKNDLQLNAPYKEMPSVYAVLSGQEKVHIVRVNKVFLGEGDANVMAKVADSINYPAGELTITLERFKAGSNYREQLDAAPASSNPHLKDSAERRRRIVFKDSVIQTEPGSFSTTQRVYVAYDDLHDGTVGNTSNYAVSGDYILTVKNNRTGNVFKAKSTIVDSMRLTNVLPFKTPFYPYKGKGWPDTEFIDYSEQEKTYSLRITPNTSQIYQAIIRFHFTDEPGSINRYVDYPGNNLDLSRDKRTSPSGQSYLQNDFKGRDVFNAVGIGMNKLGLNDEGGGRKMYMVEYFIYSSTQDYADYIEFVKPSTNISQNKPLYSNFENREALGIFTFRARCSVKKEMSPVFISSFSDNPYTCGYKFKTYEDGYRGCNY